jgi:hypothetical protein
MSHMNPNGLILRNHAAKILAFPRTFKCTVKFMSEFYDIKKYFFPSNDFYTLIVN